jgi:hypothetical protein
VTQLLLIAVLLAQLLTPKTGPKTGGISPADGNPMCSSKGCPN